MLVLKSCQYNLEFLNKFRKLGDRPNENSSYSTWYQYFPSIWIFKREVKSNIILEKFSASKQPSLITEDAFKIWFAILKLWLWESLLLVA